MFFSDHSLCKINKRLLVRSKFHLHPFPTKLLQLGRRQDGEKGQLLLQLQDGTIKVCRMSDMLETVTHIVSTLTVGEKNPKLKSEVWDHGSLGIALRLLSAIGS
jgi:hypothetical protein